MDRRRGTGVVADVWFGDTAPNLRSVGAWVLTGGALFLLAGAGLIAYAVTGRGRET